MPGAKPLSRDQRFLIVDLHRQGVPIEEIIRDQRLRREGDQRETEIFIDKRCALRWINRWNESLTTEAKKSPGRPRQVSTEEEAVRRKAGLEEAFKDANMQFTSNSNHRVNTWAHIGPYGKGDIFLAENHKDPKLGFDNQSYLKLIECSAISSIEGKLANCDDLRWRRLVQGGRKLYLFMQDNAGIHTALNRATGNCTIHELLDRLGVRYIDWPPISCDLNPIENVWHLAQLELNELLKSYKVRNKVQLFTLVKKAWENLDNNKVIRIYNSFLRRCLCVLRGKGSNKNKY